MIIDNDSRTNKPNKQGGNDKMVKKLLIAVLMVCIMALGVSADYTAVNNDDSRIDVTGTETVTGTVTLTNNNETDSIDVTAVETIEIGDHDVDISYGNTNVFTVPANDSMDVTFEFDVPQDLGGDHDGELEFTSAENNESVTVDLYVSQLAIKDLDVKIGGDTDKNIHEEEEVYEIDVEAEPQDTIIFDLELENLYSDDDDEGEVDIEDVEVTIIIKDLDDGDDLEEEADEFDIKADDSESITVEFIVPKEAVSDEYTVYIEIEAEDENGNDFTISRKFVLVVDREKHKVIVDNVYLTTNVLDCYKQTDLVVDIYNMGEREEEDVKVTVINSELGIDLQRIGIELDEDPDDDDCEMKLNFAISVGDDVAPGTYVLDVRTYYDEDVISDVAKIDLVIESCAATVVEEEELYDTEVIIETHQIPDITPYEPDAEQVTVTAQAVEITESFRDSPMFIVMLVVLNLVILGCVIWVIVRFLFR